MCLCRFRYYRILDGPQNPCGVCRSEFIVTFRCLQIGWEMDVRLSEHPLVFGVPHCGPAQSGETIINNIIIRLVSPIILFLVYIYIYFQEKFCFLSLFSVLSCLSTRYFREVSTFPGPVGIWLQLSPDLFSNDILGPQYLGKLWGFLHCYISYPSFS